MTLDKTLLAWTTSEKDWENRVQDPFWAVEGSVFSATSQTNLDGFLSNWADWVK